MVSKQYLAGKDIRIKGIKELRQKYSTRPLDESDDITGGSTLEVTYDLKDTGMSYKTATNLAVFPENTPADVKLCAELLSLGSDLDQRFIFKANPDGKQGSAAKHPFPTPVSI